MSQDHEWVDEEAGPVVRPYAVTGGRTRTSAKELDLLSAVVATGRAAESGLGAQHRRLLGRLSQRRGTPVAELAGAMDLPVGVVRVLVGDLIECGAAQARPPAAKANLATESLLREVINGLKAL
ncbi:DUF742 domain-containing protein [Nonomuraea longicatena]|uniref:DUF742 domain-containing protein n=1 Tax=Nonomuraea longicatena TaxID=83682 RepID=UPI0031DDC24C